MELEAKKRRRDAGILQITERDILALTWIAEQFSIPFDQLQRLLGRNAKQATKIPGILSISATRNAIDRWLQLALIETPRKVLKEHSSYIWLSRRGLSQLGLPYSYYLPRPSTAAHIYAVNAIRLHLESQGGLSLWQPERMLTTSTPTPDAEIRIGSQSVAVRVLDRDIKHDITLQDEVTRLLTFTDRYTRIWYFTPPANVMLLRQAMKHLDEERQQENLLQVTFYSLDAQTIHNVVDKQEDNSTPDSTILT